MNQLKQYKIFSPVIVLGVSFFSFLPWIINNGIPPNFPQYSVIIPVIATISIFIGAIYYGRKISREASIT